MTPRRAVALRPAVFAVPHRRRRAPSWRIREAVRLLGFLGACALAFFGIYLAAAAFVASLAAYGVVRP